MVLGIQLNLRGVAATQRDFISWDQKGKTSHSVVNLFISHLSSLHCAKISWARDNRGFQKEKEHFRGRWDINHCLSVFVTVVPPRANTEGNSRTIGFLESSAYQTSHQAPFAQVCSVLITQTQAALKTKGDLQTTQSFNHRIGRKLILLKSCCRMWRKEASLLETECFIFQLNKYFPVSTWCYC